MMSNKTDNIIILAVKLKDPSAQKKSHFEKGRPTPITTLGKDMMDRFLVTEPHSVSPSPSPRSANSPSLSPRPSPPRSPRAPGKFKGAHEYNL